MSGTGTEVCPWFTHWLCVVPLGGSLCHRTLSTPSVPRCAEICSWARRGDKASVTIMKRPKELDTELTLWCTAFVGLALQTHWSFTRKFFELLPFVISSPWEGSRWETMTTWASLGAPGGQGISTGPSTGEGQGGSLEKNLGVWSRATCYLGNEVLPNWIRKFHQVA